MDTSEYNNNELKAYEKSILELSQSIIEKNREITKIDAEIEENKSRIEQHHALVENVINQIKPRLEKITKEKGEDGEVDIDTILYSSLKNGNSDHAYDKKLDPLIRRYNKLVETSALLDRTSDSLFRKYESVNRVLENLYKERRALEQKFNKVKDQIIEEQSQVDDDDLEGKIKLAQSVIGSKTMYTPEDKIYQINNSETTDKIDSFIKQVVSTDDSIREFDFEALIDEDIDSVINRGGNTMAEEIKKISDDEIEEQSLVAQKIEKMDEEGNLSLFDLVDNPVKSTNRTEINVSPGYNNGINLSPPRITVRGNVLLENNMIVAIYYDEAVDSESNKIYPVVKLYKLSLSDINTDRILFSEIANFEDHIQINKKNDKIKIIPYNGTTTYANDGSMAIILDPALYNVTSGLKPNTFVFDINYLTNSDIKLDTLEIPILTMQGISNGYDYKEELHIFSAEYYDILKNQE